MPVLAINHPFYIKTVSNLERTAIRDKLLRLIQYFSRFLSFYCFKKGYSAKLISHLKALSGALSLARKAFRAGKPLGSFRAAILELSNHTGDKFLRQASVVKNVSSGCYLFLDTIVFLISTKAIRVSNPKTANLISTYANRFWLAQILSGLADAGYRSLICSSQLKALSADEKATDDEKKKVQFNFQKQKRLVFWNVLDALIPLHNLGILKTDDGLVGLAGTVTSYLGLYDLW